MATTPVDLETRTHAIATLRELRLNMDLVLLKIVAGDMTLSSVLQQTDDLAVNQLYLLKALESFSKIGKIRARQLLDDLNISHKQKIAGLSADQRRALIEAAR